MHDIRDRNINKSKLDISCLLYSNNKTQEYIIQYNEINNLREIFKDKLRLKLQKTDKINFNKEKINAIMNNMNEFIGKYNYLTRKIQGPRNLIRYLIG